MINTLATPPRSIMEVFNRLPEGTWVEIIDGGMSMLPPFSTQHQRLVETFLRQISPHIVNFDLGEVLPIIDVFLDDHSNVVLPDISFVCKTRLSIIQDRIDGVPDLIVEVLSPQNKDYDLIKKKDLYERFGVKEYWVVDPQTKQALAFQLRDKSYHLLFEGTGNIQSALLNLSFSF